MDDTARARRALARDLKIPPAIISKALRADFFPVLPEDYVRRGSGGVEDVCVGWDVLLCEDSSAGARYVLHCDQG